MWKRLWEKVRGYLHHLLSLLTGQPRPKLKNRIDRTDLKSGDVLLMRGKGTISDLILKLAGGYYTHSALFVREKDHLGREVDSVIHATEHGVVRQAVDKKLRDFTHYCDVYRFTADGNTLNDSGWPSEPVTKETEKFIGLKYAYSELLMGAIVFALSRTQNVKVMRAAIRVIGSQFIRCFEDLKEKKAMACTEVVCTGYWKADPEPSSKYGLEIGLRSYLIKVLPDPFAASQTFLMPSGQEFGAMREEVLENELGAMSDEQVEGVYKGLQPHIRNKLGGGPPQSATFSEWPEWPKAGSRWMPLNMIRPSDMERSRSLEPQGNLWSA